MPYQELSELPDSVKDNLPKHAQEIYKEAYNHGASREETSHRVAWAAVKHIYEKNEAGKWVRKGQS